MQQEIFIFMYLYSPLPLNYLFVADFKMELAELIESNTSLPDPTAKSSIIELESSVKSSYSTD